MLKFELSVATERIMTAAKKHGFVRFWELSEARSIGENPICYYDSALSDVATTLFDSVKKPEEVEDVDPSETMMDLLKLFIVADVECILNF
ncbi:unnamed protein product [Strongylus vulgaris]|uniref:Uncharacterized protein n=1 Tax=Strongylus vulgaris TaxID=40348 RepID=A0A3P7L8R8_STRVU|nr:unnamed protein product [Strongylus vulgaris]